MIIVFLFTIPTYIMLEKETCTCMCFVLVDKLTFPISKESSFIYILISRSDEVFTGKI